jgi:esterase/lipase superfamily enzyme
MQSGDREKWEVFLRAHPGSVYADLARSRLEQIEIEKRAAEQQLREQQLQQLQQLREQQQREQQQRDQQLREEAQLAAERAKKAELDALKALLPDIKGVVPVYFATNRKLKNESPVSLEAITYARSQVSAFGRVLVSIPMVHKLGVIETPSTSWFGYKEDENASKHFKIQSITKLSREEFVAAMANPSDSLMLFVHGYNVSFEGAAFKAAQIAFDAHYQGRVLMFSWPSKAGLFDYDYDRESATFSSDALFDLLRLHTS